jgi:prevent-host-death family protein
MTKTVTATQARKNFFAMLHAIETPGVSVVITHEGHPKGVLMSVDEFEGWLETMDIMSDPEEARAITNAMRHKKKERVVPLAEVIKKIGL